MNETVVMTATITPAAGMPGTKRADADLRRREYLEAFRFYLGLDERVIDHVVLLENSGEDLTIFREAAAAVAHGKKVTLLPCPTDYPSDRGKGYGEFMMLDFGLRHISDAGYLADNTRLWKVTGRLMIRNLEHLVGGTDPRAEVCCDLRSVPFIKERLGGNHWMELRVFAFTVPAYNALFEGRFGDGFVLEKTFFSTVKGAYDDGQFHVLPRFPVQPIIKGVSGFSNRSYSSPSYRVKGAVRSVARKLVPSLWI